MGAYPKPGESFGRYVVGRRIGRGGMGSVFEAVQPELNRSVALKVLSPELSEEPDFRLRFGREATMLAALDSPHVIQVYESGDHDGSLYIATQLVKGSDLAQLIEASGGLAPARALDIVAQAASGLADAHAVRLLHRDVKPSNILVRTRHDEPFAYLCDFGIARPAEGGHTSTAGVMGTVAYMAPERYDGAAATFASDIYALGCVLWAAVTGRDPFPGTSYVQIALAHVHQPVPQLSGGSPVEKAVDAILRRSMAKDPGERFGSAGEMRAALVAASELARAEPPRPSVSTGSTTLTEGSVPPPPPGDMELDGSATRPTSATVVSATSDDARRRWSRSAVGAASALVLAVIGVTGALVADGEEDPPSEASGGRSSAAAASSGVTPESATPRSSSPVRQVTCWDGSRSRSVGRCPVPVGRVGMATVFQPFDDKCEEPPSIEAPGKAEVYVCRFAGTDHLVRYSRWRPDVDRTVYYNGANAGSTVTAWRIDGVRVGTVWTSFETQSGVVNRFQRSAAYDDKPFSVSVEAPTAAARSLAWQGVRATAPQRIGLP